MKRLFALAFALLTAAAYAAGPVTDYLYHPTGTCTGVNFIQYPTAGAPASCAQPSNVTGNAATVTTADAGGDTTTWPLLGTSQTGNQAPTTDAGLTYNASTNALTASTLVGALVGNADTATALAANPTDCSSGQYANAIAASGNLTCAQVAYSQVSGTPTVPTVSGTSPQIAYFSAPATLNSDSSFSIDAANDVVYALYHSIGNGGYGTIWSNPNTTDGDQPISTQNILEIVNDPALGTGHPHLGLKGYGNSGTTGAYGPQITGMRYKGTQASPTAIDSGYPLIGVGGRGRDDAGLFAMSGLMNIVSTENFVASGDHHGTKICFETLANGQVWPRTERVCIGPSAAPALTVTGSAAISTSIDLTAISAPSTPASGHGVVYVDSTSKNLAVKDDAGVVKHGVQSKSATTGKYITAIADDGTVSSDFATLQGTSNPVSPTTGDRFYRTDLKLEIVYDGTQWLTVNEFALFAGQEGTPGTTTAGGFVMYFTLPTDYTMYLTRFVCQTRVNTTNNGTNYYTVRVDSLKADLSNAATGIVSFTTAGDTVNVLNTHDTAINATVASFGAGAVMLYLGNFVKTSSPGAIRINAALYGRKIIT